MGEKITSSNITQKTFQAAFDKPAKVPPSPETLIENIRTKLQAKIDAKDTKDNKKLKAAISAKRKLKKLDEMLADLPNDMELATVLYVKVPSTKSKRAYAEFCEDVKPAFLKYLAKNHADDLKRLGICDEGVKRMCIGLEPADKKGNQYSLSVDHIIERSGAGRMSFEQETDPHLKNADPHAKPSLKVNHFDNLILLPNKVHHRMKNFINDLQNLSDTLVAGECRWAVMLVPKRVEGQCPYIFIPRADKVDKYGAQVEPLSFKNKLSRLHYATTRLKSSLKRFNEIPLVTSLNSTLNDLAKADGKTLEKLLTEQSRSVANDNEPSAKPSIKDIFDMAFSGYASEKAKDEYNQILYLATELKGNLEFSFQAAAQAFDDEQSLEETEKLYAMLNTRNFQSSYDRLKRVPHKDHGSISALLNEVSSYKKQLRKRLVQNNVDVKQFEPAPYKSRRAKRR